ncbi:MAG: hypothetical protein HC895_11330 [Leptolyngbyaceae cyanobacterium SM1_3_5]|nr:hypothetical protein [Leptolyngbyaceae cyanobacterium SM1_3_5]
MLVAVALVVRASSCTHQKVSAIQSPAKSDFAGLPSSLEATFLEMPNGHASAAEQEALTHLRAMSNAQRAYRIMELTFAESIAQLDIGIPEETRNYRYQIIPQGNQTQRVINTAQALQPGIRSYVGVIFVTGKGLGIIICASEQPSTTPPLPILLERVDVAPRCPLGSTMEQQSPSKPI